MGSDDLKTGFEVAIVGLAGRFPGASSIEQFWDNLRQGKETITHLSDEKILEAGVHPRVFEDPQYVKAGGYLADVDLFDTRFFGFTPREAQLMDPQQRVFLECAWEVLESACCDIERFPGSIGVYAGCARSSYFLHNLLPNRELLQSSVISQATFLNDKDFLATQVSYKFNLRGPALTVQTACSTSLVAVHVACQALLAGECDLALAGGVTIIVPQNTGYLYQKDGILSPDGRCRAFDALAQGTVGGNGVGLVALKRLEDAMANQDIIYAVIKGTAINNDGSGKVGFTAPSVEGQAEVIKSALSLAEVKPQTVGYIETHGTGTTLGDPIEIDALQTAFGRDHDGQHCAIGSVKTNVGHLDNAAGVTGLIKATLTLKHQEIPPSLHYENPNPHIDFEHSPFYVNANLSHWPRGAHPRRAGVSSFGMGGTNAHVILEEPPARPPSGNSRSKQLLLFSAKTDTSLQMNKQRLHDFLEGNPNIPIADVAYTLATGRQRLPFRNYVVCGDSPDAMALLESSQGVTVSTQAQEQPDRPVMFMFTGQGAQYANMGRELYQTESVFRSHVDQCLSLLQPYLIQDLRSILFPPSGEEEWATQQLLQTQNAQPALFVIEYAMAKLWMSWGISPRAMIGHSIGEYVAACLAGVFSLQDALACVAARGQLMQGMPKGDMLSVRLSEQELLPLLGPGLFLAASNGPSVCAVSGPTQAIEMLEQQLNAKNITCRRLHTSHAFHSAMMDPILAPFTQKLAHITLGSPTIPFISNLTGDWITDNEAADPAYWAQHLRHTVRFSDGVGRLLNDSDPILLEVGPGQTLSEFARQQGEKGATSHIVSSIRHPRDRQSDLTYLLKTLGQLWVEGIEIDWQEFYQEENRNFVSLPTYAFDRQRYWIDPPSSKGETSGNSLPLSKQGDVSEWYWIPSWERSVLPEFRPEAWKHEEQGCWLIFIDACGLGTTIAEELTTLGQKVIIVQKGAQFTQIQDDVFEVHPANREDYEILVGLLMKRQQAPGKILHFWNVTEDQVGPQENTQETEIIDLGFYSLLYLTQSLEKHRKTTSTDIIVVSTGLQEVTGNENIVPAKATLLGPCKVLPQEFSSVTFRSVDVVLSAIESQRMRVRTQLLSEIREECSTPIIAYRGPYRLIQTFAPVSLNPTETVSSRLRSQGTYLITGGLGGIGLVLAKYLAQTVKANLVLTQRSAFPEEDQWVEWIAQHGDTDPTSINIRQVQALKAQGAEVLVVQADVGNREQMQSVLHRAQKNFGNFHGVIHCAGVPDGLLFQRRTREETDKVLTPKVTGTLVLADVFRDTPLDFMALCSSLASVIGPFGQLGYCAGNAFLDAFAYHNNSTGGPFTVSINWDAWQEVGMAVKAAQQIRQSPEEWIPQAPVHPLFNRCVTDGEDRFTYLSTLTPGSHWVLNEHRVRGKAILPGTAYLEMARAAFEQQTGDQSVEIQDTYFLRPLIVRDGESREVHTVLTKHQDGWKFSIQSQETPRDGVWQEHARGYLVALPGSTPRPQHKVHAAAAEMLDQGDQAALSRNTGQLGAGPRWGNVVWETHENGDGWAVLRLPQVFMEDLDDYKLHPALFDNATSLLFGTLKNVNLFVPFSYKRIRIHGPLGSEVYVHVQHQESDGNQNFRKFNVTITDPGGGELVQVDEYMIVRSDLDEFAGKEEQQAVSASVVLDDNYYLNVTTPGNLSTLHFHPSLRRAPQRGELEIKVQAAGLNFKDVLLALGMVAAPGDGSVQFGLECAGKVVAVGEDVQGWKVGDQVVAFASPCFSQYITVADSQVVPKPQQLSSEEAATIPVVFLTAYQALVKAAQLSAGERVLIHAAAGGVGLAAVQVAQWLGAEVFATAGNPRKHEFLHEVGVEHVFDSRSLSFAEDVMRVTGGAGVNVVLNSLGGEFIPKSISILAPYGRFLEIGLRDIQNNTGLGMRPFEHGLSFFAVMVGPQMPGFQSLFHEVMEHFQQGTFRPLVHKIYPATHLAEAFEYMAQAKQIGKIVISMEDTQVLTDRGESSSSKGVGYQAAPSVPTQRQAVNEPRSEHSDNRIQHGLLPSEGVQVFRRVLASNLPQVIVSTQNLSALIQKHRSQKTHLSDDSSVGNNQVSGFARPQLTTPYTPPRNETEQQIADLWQHSLGIEQIGVHDDFFQLGGNSLIAIQLLNQLRQQFNVDLSLGDLFDDPTISGLAQAVEKNRKNAQLDPISPISAKPSTSSDVEHYTDEEVDTFLRSLLPPQDI